MLKSVAPIHQILGPLVSCFCKRYLVTFMTILTTYSISIEMLHSLDITKLRRQHPHCSLHGQKYDRLKPCLNEQRETRDGLSNCYEN